MGVKRVKTSGRVKSKATPKKATPQKKLATPKKEATPKVKPETKANNVATPKAKPVKSKPTPKKKTPKKKSVSNTPVKKELNNTALTIDAPVEVKGRRKRGAPKIENDVPAKKIAKEKPTVETPAKNKVRRGRPASKANNVASKTLVAAPTPVKLSEVTPSKATNNTDKKQSKSKQAKKSPAKAKKTAAPKTPKKPQANEGKPESSAKVTKAKTSGGKRAKKTPATKTKSVLLNPVVEIEPLEHPDIKQAKMNPQVLLPRVDFVFEVNNFKMNPVVLLRRIDLYQQAKKNCSIVIPRLHVGIPSSNRQDTAEDDSPQYSKHNVSVLLPEIDLSLNACGNSSTDLTPHEIPYENEWFNKKYKPYMEKIRNLTYDEISNFVKNNKEQYEKIKDTKQKTGKRNAANADSKDLYKCNPFNSEQQLAMYLTLRELFNIPETHFKQCKSFFTIIMPEISCDLFAQIFKIKVNSAPRLIKKLYPKPVSPF